MERSFGSRTRLVAEKMRMKRKQRSPIKVVYIDNPVMVTASATEFRAIVQRLTGRHSDAAASANWDDSSGLCWSTVSSETSGGGGGTSEACDGNSLVVPAEVFDEQMLEDLFCGLMPSSSFPTVMPCS